MQTSSSDKCTLISTKPGKQMLKRLHGIRQNERISAKNIWKKKKV